MRIDEIDDRDRLWAILREINLDIDNDSAKTIQKLQILVKMKNPVFNKLWLSKINTMEQTLISILNADLANDQSTSELKNKANQYLQQIQTLKSKL
jgi:hypothetical protein